MIVRPPLSDWEDLHPEMQLALARQALQHAANVLADQAEEMAGHMELGSLRDTGGAEALRLFGRVVGCLHGDGFPTVGRA